MDNGFEKREVVKDIFANKDFQELFNLNTKGEFKEKVGVGVTKQIFNIFNLNFQFTGIKAVKWVYEKVDGDDWYVYETPFFKYTVNKSRTYHCFFGKDSGLNLRWGKTLDEDPKYCGLGPEIMDLEISVNGCIPVPGSTNCRYCYKNNTTAPARNMDFDTFVKIIETFPRNLSQIAFGIT